MRAKSGFDALMRLEIASVRANLRPMVILRAIAVPTMLAVYLSPMELQITVSGFVRAIWTLRAIFTGRET